MREVKGARFDNILAAVRRSLDQELSKQIEFLLDEGDKDNLISPSSASDTSSISAKPESRSPSYIHRAKKSTSPQKSSVLPRSVLNKRTKSPIRPPCRVKEEHLQMMAEYIVKLKRAVPELGKITKKDWRVFKQEVCSFSEGAIADLL